MNFQTAETHFLTSLRVAAENQKKNKKVAFKPYRYDVCFFFFNAIFHLEKQNPLFVISLRIFKRLKVFCEKLSTPFHRPASRTLNFLKFLFCFSYVIFSEYFVSNKLFHRI